MPAYSKKNEKSLTILLVYVDDFAIFCDMESDLKTIENALPVKQTIQL
jgi:hypothetical protein